jgi:hypothetical protein
MKTSDTLFPFYSSMRVAIFVLIARNGAQAVAVSLNRYTLGDVHDQMVPTSVDNLWNQQRLGHITS